MGTFDSIFMKDEVECPNCGNIIRGRDYPNTKWVEWQTKELVNRLKKFYEGEKMEIELKDDMMLRVFGDGKININTICNCCKTLIGAECLVSDGKPTSLKNGYCIKYE